MAKSDPMVSVEGSNIFGMSVSGIWVFDVWGVDVASAVVAEQFAVVCRDDYEHVGAVCLL
jgi:hypothetical protein